MHDNTFKAVFHSENTQMEYSGTSIQRTSTNELLDITNDFLCPGQSYSKMYVIKPRQKEHRYNEFLDITNMIREPKRKIYLDITN